MRKLATGALALLLLSFAAAPALAKAIAPQKQSSDPSDGAKLHEAPERVEVTFNEPLDPSSKLGITDDCGNQIDDGSTEVDGMSMSVGVAKKPSGPYHVEYTAEGLAGVTGEGTGHFTFTVHAGTSCDGSKGNHHPTHPTDPKGGNGHPNNHGDPNHNGNDHGTDHATSSGTHTDHTTVDGTHDMHSTSTATHDDGAHHNHGAAKANERADDDGDPDGIISADTSRKLVHRADSGALIAALALCVVLGIVGGAVLRASPLR